MQRITLRAASPMHEARAGAGPRGPDGCIRMPGAFAVKMGLNQDGCGVIVTPGEHAGEALRHGAVPTMKVVPLPVVDRGRSRRLQG